MGNAVKMNAATNIAFGSSTKYILLELRHLNTAVKKLTKENWYLLLHLRLVKRAAVSTAQLSAGQPRSLQWYL